jgi:hypothetical protein
MAAPPPRPYITPADVQGTPLARLLIAHPDAAAAVFAHLDYADATLLRAVCVGFRGAVAEHPWAPPLPLPDWVPLYGAGASYAVRTPAGLARWRSAFPAARTLALVGASGTAPPLRDADVAPAAGWGLAGVHVSGVTTLTRAGLAALCGPALTGLCLVGTPFLSGADVAAATAASPRLRTLRLDHIGPLADADLAGWGGVHALDAATDDVGGFTWDGVRHLTSVRELALPLLWGGVNWVGDAFRGLALLTRLRLKNPQGFLTRAPVHGLAGLVAPSSLPWSLRHVTLSGLALEWPPGVEPDGGAALLRPLAGVPDVSLTYCDGVYDDGLCELSGATRLAVTACRDVAGERLAPLGRTLQELVVKLCNSFTGGGLGHLSALRTLTVKFCREFRADALVDAAARCAALEHVDVAWDADAEFDAAAAEAALLAAAAGGAWAFTRGRYAWGYAWAATRRKRQVVQAPAAGGTGSGTYGAPAAGPTPAPVHAAAGAGAGGAGDDAAAAAPSAATPC